MSDCSVIIEVPAPSVDVVVGLPGPSGPASTIPGEPGPPGPPGPPGLTSSVFSGEWSWTNKTTDAATSGQVGTDATGWDTSGFLHLNEQKSDNTDVSPYLATIEAGDHFNLRAKTDSTRFAEYDATGPAEDMGSWWRLPVQMTDSGGAVPNNNAPVIVTMVTRVITVHGALDGLDADDHPQYLTPERGAALFATSDELAGESADRALGDNSLSVRIDGVEAATATALDGKAPATSTIVPKTGAAYTPVASDVNKTVTLTHGSAITLTMPPAVFAGGQRIDFLVLGTGMVTVAPGSGVSVNPNPAVSRAQYSAFSVFALSATSFVVIGDLA